MSSKLSWKIAVQEPVVLERKSFEFPRLSETIEEFDSPVLRASQAEAAVGEAASKTGSGKAKGKKPKGSSEKPLPPAQGKPALHKADEVEMQEFHSSIRSDSSKGLTRRTRTPVVPAGNQKQLKEQIKVLREKFARMRAVLQRRLGGYSTRLKRHHSAEPTLGDGASSTRSVSVKIQEEMAQAIDRVFGRSQLKILTMHGRLKEFEQKLQEMVAAEAQEAAERQA
jgi:hypothetical protein